MIPFICTQCPHQCGVDRTRQVGKCGVGYDAVVSRVALHPWEEPVISGTNGSGTIFFAGCNLHCVFCQNYAISHRLQGKTYTVDAIIDAMRQLQAQGAHNINFVTPTHYAHIVIEALNRYKPNVPVVYNSGGYENVDTLRRLQGLVDIYMPDYKYADKAVAARYSGAVDYPDVAWQAIDEMVRQQPIPVVKDGLMQRGVIVRHLVLPSYSTHSVEMVHKLYNTYGNSIYLSIMSQYVPYGDASHYPEINRTIKPLEYTRVIAALKRLGATQVFVQDATAADTTYIPTFFGDETHG